MSHSKLKMTPMTEQEQAQVNLEIQGLVKESLREPWEEVERQMYSYPSQEFARPKVEGTLLTILRSRCLRAGLKLILTEREVDVHNVSQATACLFLGVYFQHDEELRQQVQENERWKMERRFSHLPANAQPLMSYLWFKLNQICQDIKDFDLYIDHLALLERSIPHRSGTWKIEEVVYGRIRFTTKGLRYHCDNTSQFFLKATIDTVNGALDASFQNWRNSLEDPLVREILRQLRIKRGNIGSDFSDPRIKEPLGDPGSQPTLQQGSVGKAKAQIEKSETLMANKRKRLREEQGSSRLDEEDRDPRARNKKYTPVTQREDGSAVHKVTPITIKISKTPKGKDSQHRPNGSPTVGNGSQIVQKTSATSVLPPKTTVKSPEYDPYKPGYYTQQNCTESLPQPRDGIPSPTGSATFSEETFIMDNDERFPDKMEEDGDEIEEVGRVNGEGGSGEQDRDNEKEEGELEEQEEAERQAFEDTMERGLRLFKDGGGGEEFFRECLKLRQKMGEKTGAVWLSLKIEWAKWNRDPSILMQEMKKMNLP